MPSGNGSFSKSSYNEGDTIAFTYTVTDAVKSSDGIYFKITIKRPNGTIAAFYTSIAFKTGAGTLYATANLAGTWEGEVRYWYTLTNWVHVLRYTTVIAAPPPPAPPPPAPPPETYALFVYTTPGNCTLELLDAKGVSIGVLVSTPTGYAEWLNLSPGYYTIKISKEGYNDYTKLINLTGDTTFRVTLGEQTLFDQFFALIILGFESVLGWTAGTLFTKLGQMWDLIQSFSSDVYDFFSDAIGTIIDWVADNAGAIFDWLGDNFSKFIDFLGQVAGDIAGFVTDKIAGALDWVTTAFTDFTDWLGEIGGSIADYIGGAIGDFVDWSSEQLGGIWEGVQNWFLEAISGFVEAFFGGVETGIEEAKHSPLHSDEPVRNPVTKGLLKVVREHRKKYGRDEITGEKI